MSKETEADALPRQQANVWPPPPTVSPVETGTDSHEQQIAAITQSLAWSVLSFVGGCITPIAFWAVSGLLLRISPEMVKIASACVSPALYISAICFAVKACWLAVRAHKPFLVVQGVIIAALSLLFIGVFFRLCTL